MESMFKNLLYVGIEVGDDDEMEKTPPTGAITTNEYGEKPQLRWQICFHIFSTKNW